MITSHFKVLLPDLQCFHLVLDGFYGHEDYLLLANKFHLQIISKLESNAHLVLLYQGQQKPNGRPRTKGDKVDLNKIDTQFFIKTTEDKESKVKTQVYQFQAQTTKMAGQLLNIVVMVPNHQITKRQSRTILFTNDLNLDSSTIIKFYSLRFQIEFDFRDAKQFYGLDDFKNYKQTQVTNAVNLAFTMTTIGKLVLEKYKQNLICPNMGLIDLKTVFRTQKYAQILLNKNNFDPDIFLSTPQFLNIARLEAIHI